MISLVRTGSTSRLRAGAWPAVIAAAVLVTGALAPPSAPAHDDPATDGLIDGGGSSKTDCVAKFQTGIELNYPAAPKKSKELRCVDGDLACDTDGAVNGSCTLNVGICLADDEEVFQCLPAGVPPAGVAITNKPVGHKKHDAELQALQDEVDSMLGLTGIPCESPGAGGGNCLQCTNSQVAVSASMSVKKGKKKIKMKTVTEPTGVKSKPIKDVDKLSVRCVECESPSTFDHVSRVVFKTGCAASLSCHTGATPAGGLNLDVDDIGPAALYATLVSDAPTSPGAAALGMNRITPFDTALGTDSSTSLLYEKLARTNSELDALCTLGGQGAGCLGIAMPPGADLFSSGKLELLQAWIENGAPETGWVDGATCGEPEDLWEPATPPAPPAPGEGFQLHMPQPPGFFLEPGTEFEGCQWLEIPDTVTETWYIDRVELVANSGTHHLILVEDVPDAGPPATPLPFDPADVACTKSFGINAFRVVAQDPEFELELPENVAFTVEPGQVFGINPHYVNNNNVPIYPEVWFNFYGSTTPSPVVSVFNLPGPTNFVVPPGEVGRSVIAANNNFGAQGRCYFSLTTHQHRRGTGMKVWSSEPSSWDDSTDLLMYSTDWDHPGWLQPSPRLYIPPGASWYSQCEWDNGVLNDVNRRCQMPFEGTGPDQCNALNPYVCITDDDCPAGETTGLCRDCNLDFGLLSEDEMCYSLSYFYPSQPGPDPCPY